ncbi:MAG: SUMF1/EgtB/PvdO family nonheme iron enzyme [Polyangiaceae bacterium]
MVLPAGTLRIGPGDWEAAGIEPREAVMSAFAIDAYEVTEARWQRCIDAGKCAPEDTVGGGAREPGLPVTGKTLGEAEALCASAGGRLSSANELAWAAAGAAGRRYPWGDTGAVCRRAVWGMVDGPCAHDAVGPDLTGSRPDGASPEGVFDLAGNVAEWARGEGAERAEVRGGTFRDEAAARLRSWNRRDAPAELRSAEVGFRCTYAAPPPAP